MATYTWKKYSLKTTSTTTYTEKNDGSYTKTNLSATKRIRGYSAYTFDSSTGTYEGSGSYSDIYPYTANFSIYKYIFSFTSTSTKSGTTMYVFKSATEQSDGNYTITADRYMRSSSTTTTTSKGTYIEDVTSTNSSTYPTNGEQNGYWYVKTNVAPTTPGVPSFTTEIKGGDSITVTWAASTDPEGSLSGYQLDIQLDGGSWTQVYKGSSRSYTSTVPEGTETIAFRVRAYDSSSAYSSYATSATVAVASKKSYGISGKVTINNVAKTLTGEGYANIDGILKPIVKSYSCINSVWMPMHMRPLPDGYSYVEYIESTGTQYIDTGVMPTANLTTTITYQCLPGGTTEHAIFGSAWSASGYFFMAYSGVSGFRWHSGGASVDVAVSNATAVHTATCTPTSLTLDGTTHTVSPTEPDLSYPIRLFGVTNNQGYTGAKYGILRLYSCQIYDNGTLVRNFIPCIKSDGTAGLYDKVNSAFYGNAGTGAFTAGATIA